MNGISVAVLLTAALAAAILFWPGPQVWVHWQRRRDFRRRAVLEDVLKHIFTRQHEGREASLESAAGHLGLSEKRMMRLIVGLEGRGLLRSEGGRLALTEAGEKLAVQVVRAHRLWETYLADEARMPMSELHKPAEAAEHRLTASEVDELDARLGHPRRDPHGDPIPTSTGDLKALEAEPLTSWPTGKPAQVAHVEDEPEAVFRRITNEGVRPGAVIEVRDRSADHLTISDGEREYRLEPLVAGNIQVVAVPEGHRQRASLARLSELATGEEAEVVLLDAELRGLTRRRLLDLGLTPSARVTAHLENAFGDPLAYRVRGTTIALRRDQASKIWVRRAKEAVAR